MREFLFLTFLVLLFMVILHTRSTKGIYNNEDNDPFYMSYRRTKTTKKKAPSKSPKNKPPLKTTKHKAPSKTTKNKGPIKNTKKTVKPLTKKTVTTKRTTKKSTGTTTKKTTVKTTREVKMHMSLFPSLENYQVGATPASEEMYPWVARVIHSRTRDTPHMCTAVCIDRAIFITAARCLHTIKVEFTTIKYLERKFPVIAFVTPSNPTRQSYEDVGIIIVNAKGFRADWATIEIELTDVKRSSKDFKWFSDLKYSKEEEMFRVVGYAAKKFYHRLRPPDLPRYDLCQLDVIVSRTMCANILTLGKMIGFLVPCYMACTMDDYKKQTLEQKQVKSCNNYHGVEGGAVININTNKLIGVTTWGAYALEWELPVGFAVPNSDNFFKDYKCATKIRDSPKPKTGSYQQVCSDGRK